jgi:hypothetical protein
MKRREMCHVITDIDSLRPEKKRERGEEWKRDEVRDN